MRGQFFLQAERRLSLLDQPGASDVGGLRLALDPDQLGRYPGQMLIDPGELLVPGCALRVEVPLARFSLVLGEVSLIGGDLGSALFGDQLLRVSDCLEPE